MGTEKCDSAIEKQERFGAETRKVLNEVMDSARLEDRKEFVGRTVSFDSIAAAVETVNFVLHPIEIPKWR